MQMQSPPQQQDAPLQGPPVPSLFDDKGGLARFGGMAASITAVSQVAEQLFSGSGLYVGLVFSCLVALYYSKRAFQLGALDSLVWVPIYTCVIFVTALGSNNVIGLSQDRKSVPLDEYRTEVRYYEAKLKDYEETVNEQKALISKYKKLKDILESSLRPIPSVPDNRHSQIHKDKNLFRLSSLVDLFSPKEACAQDSDEVHAPATRRPPPSPKQLEILKALREIEEAEKKLDKTTKKLEKPKPKPEIRTEQQRIWQKWGGD